MTSIGSTLTDETPIVDVVDPLTLKVNLASGQTWIANDSTIPYTIDSYRITDANSVGALDPVTWNSLSDQGIDAVDGPADPDNIPGNGIGETWDEAGGSNPKALAESFLFGSSTIAPTEQLTLGQAVTPGSSPALGFEFRRKDTGAILPGLIAFVTGISGDFDNNGDYSCPDVDALVGAIVAGTNDAAFDLTGDGLVNNQDLTAWLAEAGAAELTSGNSYLYGDADLDGIVDGQDFIVWNTNKFSSTAAWCFR